MTQPFVWFLGVMSESGPGKVIGWQFAKKYTVIGVIVGTTSGYLVSAAACVARSFARSALVWLMQE